MVNPGVIELVSIEDMRRLNTALDFRVEDNLGESIHIHYKDFRMDLSVEEFLNLTDIAGLMLNELISCDGFDFKDFDPTTIIGNAEKLLHLRMIEYTELHLDDILIPTYHERKKDMPIEMKHVSEAAVYRAIEGDTKEENTVPRVNYFHSPYRRCTNQERIEYQLERIPREGYPTYGNLILVNANNELIDGWHRASVLRYLYGNIQIPVRRLLFDIPIFDTARYNMELAREFARRDREIERLKEFCASCDHIYLYGAGKWGGRYFFLLSYFNISVDGFIETVKHKDTYFGRPVYNAEDYPHLLTGSDGVILSTCALDKNQARKNLHVQNAHILAPDSTILGRYAGLHFHDEN